MWENTPKTNTLPKFLMHNEVASKQTIPLKQYQESIQNNGNNLIYKKAPKQYWEKNKEYRMWNEMNYWKSIEY